MTLFLIFYILLAVLFGWQLLAKWRINLTIGPRWLRGVCSVSLFLLGSFSSVSYAQETVSYDWVDAMKNVFAVVFANIGSYYVGYELWHLDQSRKDVIEFP